MRRVLAAAAVAAAGLAASPLGSAAEFASVDPGVRQSDLTTSPAGTFILGAVALSDGSWVVSEDQPPGGDGRLHLVPPGAPLSTGNAIGQRRDIASLALRRGQLFGLSLDPDPVSGDSPLYRIDAHTGAVLGTVAMWPKGTPEIAIDPLSEDLVLQKGGTTGSIVRLDPDTGHQQTIVATAPSLDVEGLLFDRSGQTLYVGNSQDNRVSAGQGGGVDGVYAYSRSGALLYSFATDGSPDGFAIGPPGSCLAGQLIFTTDPVLGNQQQEPGRVEAVAAPSATTGLTPRTLATTAGPPGANLMYVTTDAAGYPVVSHSNQLTRLSCPSPPPPPPTLPPPPPPSPPPPPAPPPAHPAAPVHQAPGAAPATTSVSHAAVPVAPPAPGAPGAATAPAAQAQAQSAVAGQAATQAAPSAGLVDVPDEQPSVAFSARALDLQRTPAWIRLTLGAMAVTAMAGAGLALTRPDRAAGRAALAARQEDAR